MRTVLKPLLLALLAVSGAHAAEPDWTAVARAIGKPGAVQPGGVYKIALPRTDLQVVVDGVTVRPALALGSWLAFAPAGADVMVMGDLVLTQEEVNPVLSRLAAGGIEVTALHNHLLRARPATLYMHVEGHGSAPALAATLSQALGASATPVGDAPAAPAAPLDLDTALIDRALGAAGKASGGVYQVSIPRPERIVSGGMPVPPSMGTATALNFQPTGGGRAAVAGDLVLTAAEVNPVLRKLREGGIEVAALHNHMLADEPRLFFVHFWANDDAGKLARGLRAALDQTAARAH